MIRRIPAIAALCIVTAHGQIAFNGNYTENFDSMTPTGTDYVPGWTGIRYAGSGALGLTLAPGVSTGTSTGGGIYNVGAAGDTDRALGSLSSASTVPRFGAGFINASGATYTELTLSGVMEQWRSGSSATANETLPFEFSLNATGINDETATWTAAPGFDLLEKLVTTTSAAAVDGNLADNQTPINVTLSDLNWQDGQVLTFRWTDRDDTGSDGMYALDNFSLAGVTTPVPEPAAWGLLLVGTVVVAWLRRKDRE